MDIFIILLQLFEVMTFSLLLKLLEMWKFEFMFRGSKNFPSVHAYKAVLDFDYSVVCSKTY